MNKKYGKSGKFIGKNSDIKGRKNKKGGLVDMAALALRSDSAIQATCQPHTAIEDSKSEWDDLREWGTALAKKAGFTKEDSRRILQRVRQMDESNS